MLKNKNSIALLLSILFFTHLNLQAMETKEEEKEEYMDHSPARILPSEIVGMVLLQNIKLTRNFGDGISTIKCFQFSDKHTKSVVETLLKNPLFIEEVKKQTLQKNSYGIDLAVAEYSIKKMLNPTLAPFPARIAPHDTFKTTYKSGHKKLAKFYYVNSTNDALKNDFFHTCALENDLNMTAFCLRNQANVDVIIDRNTALMNAVEKNQIEMVTLLLSYHANKNIVISESRRFGIGAPFVECEKTAISIANRLDNTEILKLLEN